MSGPESKSPPDQDHENSRMDEIGQRERRIAWVYKWLMLSPFLTVPWLFLDLAIVGLSGTRSLMAWSIAVLAPASLHLVLLKDRNAPEPFVRAHSRQAFWMAVVRTISTWYLLGLTQGEAFVGWFFINGSLTLFGSIWGWRQVRRGDCWLVRQSIWSPGELMELPRTWALPEGHRAYSLATQAAIGTPEREPQPKAADSEDILPEPVPAIEPELATPPMDDYKQRFVQANSLISQGRRVAAVAAYMEIFNHGPADLRQHSILRLEELGGWKASNRKLKQGLE